MVNEEVIEIKNISDIKSNIVNYDIFDGNIMIATEKDEIFKIKYNLDIEEEVIKKIEKLVLRLENNLKLIDKDIKLFNKGLVGVIIYTSIFICLSILTSSFIPLIFSVSSPFLVKKLVGILNEYKKEFKQTNLSLDILKSTLYIKEIKFQQKKSAQKCREKISQQSNKKSDSKLLRELREQLVGESVEEKDKTMTKHK